MNLLFRNINENDWNDVKNIYQNGIDTGHATFQTSAPENYPQFMESRGANSTIIALINNVTIGWASVSPISNRCVYSGLGEVSIYMNNDYKGLGYGFQLLQYICNLSEDNGFWSLTARIFPENTASVAIHSKCGFRVIGTEEKIGKHKGLWRDTLYLQRRSTLAQYL